MRRLLPRRSAAFALLLAAGSALAGPPPLPQADADAWLDRIREAGRCSNYHGTLVTSDGTSVSSSRVMHFCEGKDQYEGIEALDGKANRTWRHNDLVHTVWPGSNTVVIEQRAPLGAFPALLQLGGFHVEQHYDLRLLGIDRVAGLDTNVILLKPHDDARFAQRLWAERQTGLLLRADVLGPDGALMERVSFSEIAIGGRAKPELVLKPMRALGNMKVVHPTLRGVNLDTEGWLLAVPVQGFKLVASVRRQLDFESRAAAVDATVLQAIFSDGLTQLSLFIEPYDAGRHASEMSTRIGATYTTMRQVSGHWVTVMGDVPLETLQKFAAALKRKP